MPLIKPTRFTKKTPSKKPKPKKRKKAIPTPNPVGRPTKYKPEYCQVIIDYFDIPATDSEGNANNPRFLSAFARSIGVNHDTLHEWCSVYPEFSEAYTEAKRLQGEHIIVNALQNRYNSSFAWRTMMNIQDWRDKQEHAVAVKPLVVFEDEKQPIS